MTLPVNQQIYNWSNNSYTMIYGLAHSSNHATVSSVNTIFHTAELVTRVKEEEKTHIWKEVSERKRTLIDFFCNDVHAGRFSIKTNI